MKCEEVRKKLVDVLDEDPATVEMTSAHLENCESCRQELEELQGGHECLSLALPELSGRGRDVGKHKDAFLRGVRDKQERFLTWPRVLATAAMVAIVVSGLFLYQDVKKLFDENGSAGGAGMLSRGALSRRPAPRLRLASSRDKQQLREVVGFIRASEQQQGAQAGASRKRDMLVLTKSSGFLPAGENGLYDGEQEGYWW